MRIDDEVLAVLSAAQTEGCNVFLTGQLDRKLYDRTNKVLEAADGQWNRKARAHVFAADAFDRMDQIILSGSVEVPVHCRIGSSENGSLTDARFFSVHCRIGSSERRRLVPVLARWRH